ncbi:MAG: helicase RecQ [Candidatus Parcubacteria bacterium]|jgi:ATP-dependent DNA helicase RecQ
MHDIHHTLRQYFGYSTFRPLQEQIIRDTLDKKDVLALMPTGGGKSLCFQLPALLRKGVTIVISPLISLMKDQVDALRFNGIQAAYLNSTLTQADQQEIEKQLVHNQLSLLYIAPERLMQQKTMAFLKQLQIASFVIDEAHCISEWGHDFRPEYRQLNTLRPAFPDTPVAAFTATATPRVKTDIINQLNLTNASIYQVSFNRSNLQYRVQRKENDIQQIAEHVHEHPNQSGIIYCQTRDKVDTIAALLQQNGYKALPYHAGLDDSVRKDHQEQFKRDDVDLIVATIAFGMGIDKPSVRFIIHHGLPSSIERYYQETGRAGRDGLTSECILLYSPADVNTIDYFIRQKENISEQDIARWQLRQMVTFAETALCRRSHLLQYFGEEYKQNCQSCDNCLQPPGVFDATVIAQQILSCVYRLHESFGVSYVTKILTGSRSQRITQYGHDQLSTYGLIKGYTRPDVTAFIRELAEQGYLVITTDTYPVVRLTEKSAAVLKGTETVYLHTLKQKHLHAASTIDTQFDEPLFAELRVARKRLADKHDVPPYVIFSDAALKEMAVYYPQTHDQLAQIKGVGEQKLKLYGNLFIEIIKSYCEPQGIQPKSIFQKKPQPKTTNNSSVEHTLALYQQGLSLKEIATQRKLSVNTIAGHLEQAFVNGADIDISKLIHPTKQQTITKAFKKIGMDRLTPVKAHLGEDYSYEELRLVRAVLSRE